MSTMATILVVDDDRANRLILQALLRGSGFNTVEAENGRQAVEVVGRCHVDIVLIDVMMPVMDGYEATRIIKQRSGSFIPIIFLTALSDEQSLVKCIRAGGDDFLIKPYNHVLLRAKIDSMLRIQALYKKVEEQNQELNRHNSRVEQEIELARQVFGNLLDHDMAMPGTGLRFSMSPMSMFNGDTILAECNQTGGLDVLVSDFTGHGLSAAMGSIPVSDIFYTMTRKGFSGREMLVEANTKLVRLLPTHMFMATALISVDRNNNILTVINCGFPDLYLYRNGEIIRKFHSKNIPVGISLQNADEYIMDMQSLEYGDRLYACTDGILEAGNEQGVVYGKKRFVDSITGATSPDEIFDKILQDSRCYSRKTDQLDDITLFELCHLERVSYPENVHHAVDVQPSEWSMQFRLDINSLRQFDVLPYIMQGVNELRSIPNSYSTLYTILTEIFTNALDHGVLGLDSSQKNTPEGYMQYYQQKTQRLDALQDGYIDLMLRHELKENGGGRLTIHAVDSGGGFDYSALDFAMENPAQYSGRGLNLINQLCKEVKIMGKGNVIMAVYEWD